MVSKRKQKQRRKQERREIAKVDPPDQEILDSIGGPNAWTPEAEDTWINELKKMSAAQIYRRYPPLKKPPNVAKQGKRCGWD